jgi:uncharacterized protein YcfL
MKSLHLLIIFLAAFGLVSCSSSPKKNPKKQTDFETWAETLAQRIAHGNGSR